MQNTLNRALLALLMSPVVALTCPTGALAADLSATAASAADWGNPTDQSLTDAVSAIEKTTGGKILEIRFRPVSAATGNALPGFDAVVAKQGKIVDIRVDSPVRAVTELSADSIPEWMLSWPLRADQQSVSKESVPLADLIRRAENTGGGPAVYASLARPLSGSNSVLAFDIAVLRDGRLQRMVLDAQTGEVIADPNGLVSPWSPERLLSELPRKG
jgi:hypothetical protein